MGRGSEAERADQVAELPLDLFVRQPQDLEDAFLDLRIVDPDGAAAELEAVQDQVVGARLRRARLEVVGERRRERVMVRDPLVLVVAPLEQLRFEVPDELPAILRDQIEPSREIPPEPVERYVRSIDPVGDETDQIPGPGTRPLEDPGALLVAQELLDRRPERSLVLDRDPHEPGGAAALRVLDELVQLLAREGRGTLGGDEALDRAAVGRDLRERREPRALEELGELRKLHPVPEVGLIRAVAFEHLVVGHATEGRAHVGPLRLPDDPSVERFDHRHDVLLLGERHLDVELRELEPAVGARLLVAEASHDLVVAVLSGDHQQLLQLLRGLRQRVEGAGEHP